MIDEFCDRLLNGGETEQATEALEERQEFMLHETDPFDVNIFNQFPEQIFTRDYFKSIDENTLLHIPDNYNDEESEPKKRSYLSTQAKTLLGQANSAFLSSDHQLAINLLKQVIKESPNAYEGYLTLGMVYEDMQDDKCLGCYMVANHLRSDEVQWKRLGEMLLERGMVEEGIYCLRKCASEETAMIISEYSEKDALAVFRVVERRLKKNEQEFSLEGVQEFCRLLVKNEKYKQALVLFKEVYEKADKDAETFTDILNIYTELLILNKKYSECFNILHENELVKKYLDLNVNLLLSQIYLKKKYDENIIKSVANIDDLFDSILAALFESGEYEKYLKYAVGRESDDDLLRMAVCHQMLNSPEKALELYLRVLEQRDSYQLRLIIASVYDQLGETDVASEYRDEDIQEHEKWELLDQVQLLFEERRSLVLSRVKELNAEGDYVQVCTLLRPMVSEYIHHYQKDKIRPSNTTYSGLGADEWFKIVLEYLKALDQLNGEDTFNTILECERIGQFYYADKKRNALYLFGISQALKLRDYKAAYEQIRLLWKFPTVMNYQLISVFNSQEHIEVIDAGLQKYFRRQVMELYEKKLLSDSDKKLFAQLCYNNGLVFLVNKSYTHAIPFLLEVLKTKKDPLVLLAVGVAYLHAGMQRTSDNKRAQYAQGLAYISEYAALRGENGESYYNLARAFHAIGLPCIEYYEKAGELGMPEAWYNLMKIYEEHGNFEMAGMAAEKLVV